jgi:hypothetical protein
MKILLKRSKIQKDDWFAEPYSVYKRKWKKARQTAMIQWKTTG